MCCCWCICSSIFNSISYFLNYLDVDFDYEVNNVYKFPDKMILRNSKVHFIISLALKEDLIPSRLETARHTCSNYLITIFPRDQIPSISAYISHGS